MSKLQETAPRTIYLCVSDDEDDAGKPYPELYAEDAEITWSTDQPVAVTVEYIRADLYRAALEAVCDAFLTTDKDYAAMRMHQLAYAALGEKHKRRSDEGSVTMRMLHITRDALGE
jgi:hypothetical protein